MKIVLLLAAALVLVTAGGALAAKPKPHGPAKVVKKPGATAGTRRPGSLAT